MQVSSVLRRGENRYFHWCPACQELHQLPDSWYFDGNLEKPTFSPSFKHTGCQTEKDATGRWTGNWILDVAGNPVPFVCHYVLTAGILNYCSDCTHSLAGQSLSLPILPQGLTDA